MRTHALRTLVALALLFSLGLFLHTASGCGVAKDTKLQMKIREELSKHRDVQVDKLTINVHEGVVTITGELYTREEIDKVVEIVSRIEGVIQVKNHMKLPDDWHTRNPTFLDPF